MDQSSLTPQDMLRQMYILFYALIIGVVLFCVVSIYLVFVTRGFCTDSSLNFILQILALMVSVSSVTAGTFIFKRQIAQLSVGNITLMNKMEGYRTALLIKLATLEGGTFFSIIVFLLTGNYYILALAAIVIIIMIMSRPTINKIAAEISLDYNDIEELQKF